MPETWLRYFDAVVLLFGFWFWFWFVFIGFCLSFLFVFFCLVLFDFLEGISIRLRFRAKVADRN